MDIIREILLAVEGADTSTPSRSLKIDGDWSVEEINYHIALLIEANYLKGLVAPNGSYFMIDRLTWEGHDFLDAVRSKTIWEKTKAHLQKTGAGLMPVLVKEVAIMLIRAGIGKIAS